MAEPATALSMADGHAVGGVEFQPWEQAGKQEVPVPGKRGSGQGQESGRANLPTGARTASATHGER